MSMTQKKRRSPIVGLAAQPVGSSQALSNSIHQMAQCDKVSSNATNARTGPPVSLLFQQQ